MYHVVTSSDVPSCLVVSLKRVCEVLHGEPDGWPTSVAYWLFFPYEQTVWEPGAPRQTRKLDLDAPSPARLSNLQPPEDPLALKYYPVDHTRDGM